MTALAKQIVEAARAQGRTISTAESCTAGMIAVALTDVSGSSSVFERGFITYSNQAKQDLLGLRSDTLETYGAVSEKVAHEMAQGALMRSGASLAVSVTGIAGPGGSEFKPEGRVCFGLACAAGTTTETVEFGALGRRNVRFAARDHALCHLLKALESTQP